MKTLKNNTLIVLILIVAQAFPFFAKADEPEAEAMTAIELKVSLQQQLALLERIEPYTQMVDLARINYLKKLTHKTRALIEKKKNIGNVEVVFAIQELVLSYDYSVTFFNSISSEVIESDVQNVYKIQKRIIESFGLDKATSMRMIANMMGQIRQLILQLQPLVGSELKARLDKLAPSLGETLAKASLGDRPKAFYAGVEFYKRLIELYPMMNQLGNQQQAFNITIEIRSLAEFFREYAQIEEADLRSAGEGK